MMVAKVRLPVKMGAPGSRQSHILLHVLLNLLKIILTTANVIDFVLNKTIVLITHANLEGGTSTAHRYAILVANPLHRFGRVVHHANHAAFTLSVVQTNVAQPFEGRNSFQSCVHFNPEVISTITSLGRRTVAVNCRLVVAAQAAELVVIRGLHATGVLQCCTVGLGGTIFGFGCRSKRENYFEICNPKFV
jgi:hypothetical protein